MFRSEGIGHDEAIQRATGRKISFEYKCDREDEYRKIISEKMLEVAKCAAAVNIKISTLDIPNIRVYYAPPADSIKVTGGGSAINLVVNVFAGFPAHYLRGTIFLDAAFFDENTGKYLAHEMFHDLQYRNGNSRYDTLARKAYSEGAAEFFKIAAYNCFDILLRPF